MSHAVVRGNGNNGMARGAAITMTQERVPESRQLDAVLRALTEGLIVTDAAGCIAEINPAAERITAWQRAEALGRTCTEVLRLGSLTGNTGQPALGHDPGSLADIANGEWMLVARDSRRLLIQLRSAPVNGHDAAAGLALAFSDITQESLMAQERSFRSTHDALTGLLNRDEFVRRVGLACAAPAADGLEHVVAILDVDQFQSVNDALGHAAGDRMLRELALEFRSRLPAGHLLARLSADEFGVLLGDCTPQEGERVLESLLQAARSHRLNWDGHSIATSVSIGATRITAGAHHEARLLSLVDAACFAAKNAGRDCLRYLDADHALSHRADDLSIASHLSTALDQQRFVLCYQNAMTLDASQRIVYRELLLRLRHERGELILPHRFIPAAEHYFLLNAIDRWVVRSALLEIAARPPDGVIHAINLSGQSISDPGFLRFVIQAFADIPVDPTFICFEISENVAVTRLSDVARFMHGLRQVGCRFAIDHFGSGMASFGYIKNLPVDFIKIEGSLVRAMLGSRMDHSLVDAIHRVGRDMGVTTIAEHVERLELVEPLRAIGVDLAQGIALSPIQLFSTG